MLKNIAFIPAKGNSERVKNKNARCLNGKSLYYIACENAILSGAFDQVYIDTEQQDFYKQVKHLNVKLIKRPDYMASNKYGANDLLRHEIKNSEPAENYYMLNCTTPLVKPSTIRDCVTAYQNSDFDSVLTVLPFSEYLWANGKPKYDIEKVPTSQEMNNQFMESHILYGIKRESFLQLDRRIGNNPMFWKTDKIEATDINTEEDFKITKALYDIYYR